MSHRFLHSLLCFIFVASYGFTDILFSREKILEYKSIIEVKIDGTLDVMEKITVLVEGRKIKRGIYRDFPTNYKDRAQNRVIVNFIVQEVLRNGSPEPYSIQNKGNGKSIRIGSKNVFLPSGQHTYTLKYTTKRQIGFFKDFDELYFNAIPQDWIFPIDQAEVKLVLPDRAEILQYTAYTGSYSSKNENYSTIFLASNIIQFINTSPFAPKEGMSIAVAWAKGIINKPTQIEIISYFLKDNSAFLILLLGLVLLLFYYLYAWNKVGRDPEQGAIVPCYNPPKNFSPAAVRYVLNMCFDKRSFTAAIVNIARKGYLDIIEEDKEFTLKKKNQDISKLTRGERVLADKLFRYKDIITLENKEHSRFRSAIYGLKKELKKEFRSHYFNLNLSWLAPGMVISLASFVLMILSLLFSMSDITPIMLICLVAIIGVNILFAWLIRAPTLQGRKIMDAIEGLKMYLSVAEKERLNLLNPPERTPELFEYFLPYAIALEVENEWGDQFTSVFSKLDQDSGQYHPSWYYGHNMSSFALSDFTSSLGSSLSSSISSATSPPGSSSASGGGGFSGGGGGGGGGGGW